MIIMFKIKSITEDTDENIRKRVVNLLSEHLQDYDFSLVNLFIQGAEVDFAAMELEGDIDD